MMMHRNIGFGKILKISFCLGYAFLYLPILLIIVYSFNNSTTEMWKGFSFQWYRILMENQLLLDSLVTSFQIGMLSATLSVILGTLCAQAWTLPGRNHRFLGLVASMPLVVPETIMGLSLLILFVSMEKMFSWPPRGFLTIVFAHTTLGIAYVTSIVRSRLMSLNPQLREAALDLGARPVKIFFVVTLPIISPSLIASWLIAFVLSFDDLILASFTTGPGTSTLPLVIFSSLKMGYTPQINALASCIIVLVSTLTFFAVYGVNKSRHGLDDGA